MRGKGQLLLSTLLLLCLNVVAQNEGAHAKVDSDSDEGKVRVTSSLLTSPGVGISSSSSSSSSSRSGGGAAAFTGQAALHEGLDAVQRKLSPSFPPGSAESSLFFMNHAHKLPFQAASTSSIGRAQNASSSVRQPESVKREENNHLLHPRYFPRTRRGGYTAPYFVGKRMLQEKADQEQELEKRYILSGIRMDGLQNPQESLNREAALFTDKRRSPLFIGKRSTMDHSEDNEHRVKRQAYNAPYFVGKRALEESEDLEQEELQKREVPDDDSADDLPALPLDIPDFDPDDAALFPDKRRAPLFIGKRRAPFFVGKRWAPYFVGKRQAAPYFVGKRTYPTISSRAAPLFVGRRRYAPLFVGKRHAPMFVGKRRAPMFVGKRPSKDLNELLSALHTLQAARHYRRMIQADKRHNAPFFIDGQPSSFGSVEEEDEGGSSWRPDSTDMVSGLDKRFHEFVGKRAESDKATAGKRYEFIGKRAPYEFIGKRLAGVLPDKRYEFIGKRAPYEFIGKRPKEFVTDKRYEFIGKRAPYEFLGKRSAGVLPDKRYEFIGKRAPYEFLGKRSAGVLPDKRYEFIGKRAPYEFLGKRSAGVLPDKRYEFIGKRAPYEFLGKRSAGGLYDKRYEFIGKRAPYEFLGKRLSQPVADKRYEFIGKRAPYEFLGKRQYEFLGKRNVYEFLGKRNTVADQSQSPPVVGKRVLVDIYGKRVELPYEFVGKRSYGEESKHTEGESLLKGSATTRLSSNRTEADRKWLRKRGVRSVGQLFRSLATSENPTSSLHGPRGGATGLAGTVKHV